MSAEIIIALCVTFVGAFWAFGMFLEWIDQRSD